jgi:hypothetical protein
MLRHVDNNYTVQVTCPACKVAFVVILQLEEREESPVEAVGVPAGPDPISADELLDLHEFLDGFEGTFSDLLHADSGRRA